MSVLLPGGAFTPSCMTFIPSPLPSVRRNVVGPMGFTGVDFSTMDVKCHNTNAAELSDAVSVRMARQTMS